MVRQFGTTATSIWDDPDWWDLTGEQQRVYLMLTTQKDITPAGTLPLTLGRWASSTKGCTIEGLSKTLRELSDAAYIVVDWRRELLLIRSFVRWDRGYTNEKRLRAIQSAAVAVGPPELAGVLAFELDRLGINHGITAPPIDAKSKGHRSPIDGVSIDAGSGYVSSNVPEPEPDPFSGTGNREPQPADVPSAAPAKAAAPRARRIPDEFTVTAPMRSWAQQHVPGLDIDWCTEQFQDHWRSSSRNAAKADWTAAWRRWMRDEHEKPNARRIQGRASPGPSDLLRRAGTPPIPGGLTLQQERAWRTRWCELIKAGQSPDQATRIATAELAA